MMTVFRWEGSTRAGGRVAAERLPTSAAEVAGEDMVWVDLSDPTPEEEQAVFEKFLPVHTLTREDVTKPRREPDQGAHFPKVEEFPDYLFVIVNPLPAGLAEYVAAKPAATPPAGPAPEFRPTRLGRKHRPQLSAVLTHNVLVTHHYHPLEPVAEVQAYLDRHGETARRGPDYVFHLILDAMVDDYAPVVERIAARLDRLEAQVFRKPSPDVLARLLRLKRLVTGLRKTLILEREVLARLTRGEFELVDEREVAYYRNVFDHLVRYTELIDSAREMVGDLMQTHLSANSNQLNRVMKVLSMISTLVLPMTLIAGIYGMNFEESEWPDFKTGWGFPFALAVMAVTGVSSFLFFRWKGWA